MALSPGVAETVELAVGDWIITARAYHAGAATAAAAGWAALTVSAGESVAERITLAPGDGAGTFAYTVAVPGGLSAGALTLTRAGLDGADAAVDGGTRTLTAGVNAGTIELPGGYYLLTIRLAKGGLSAGRTELIHLYPGLTTEAAGPDYVFTDDDLAVAPEPPAPPTTEPPTTEPPATEPPAGTPATGGLSITVGLSLAHELTLSGYGGPIVLSGTGANSAVTLSAEGYSAVAWYVDGEEIGAGDGSITLNAADYDARPHSLTFRGVREGVPYAKLLPFTVTAALPADLPEAEPDPEAEPETGTPYALAITVGAGASQAELAAAIGAAVAALPAAPGGTGPGPGEAWELRVSGLDLSGGLGALYAAAVAALPAGDIALDLGGCTGESIAYALSGSAEEQQAIRERFTALTLSASVATIGGGAKAGSAIKSALGGFSRLRQVSGGGVTAIGENGLRDCAALEGVSFPALESAGKEAFSGCGSLAAVDFPLATSIAGAAFSGCAALETGSFPQVVSFGSHAFTGCTALGSLVLGASPPTAPIFNGLVGQAITITVPPGRKAAYEAACTSTPWGGNVTVTFVEG
ncbi:putative surface antigen BspA [Treponema primitia ZAS-2]|uniref:Putative surface antigen BspA n=1 Tax=Treponema primitia (strain ATCC BAA-887 / DSM 12427 / ZAS-2) TaxID=545694 RepID=F5YIM2_TREPZ|nr:putative surface antigen BspA [Treponema primitia ZAS-2]